jgi:CBS domain containing-hemolysin-like protein
MLKKQDLTYEDAAPLGIITLEDVIEELLGEVIHKRAAVYAHTEYTLC